MSTNVKIVGYYKKFNSEEDALNAWRNQGFEVKGEDDYYNLPTWGDKENEWLPFIDYEGNFGMIYVVDYEYDSFDLCHVFELGDSYPKFQGSNYGVIPFAVLYYNGSDMPLVMK